MSLFSSHDNTVGKVLAPFSVHVDQGSGSSHDVLSKARTQNSHILTATHKGFLPHPKDDLDEGSPIKLSVMMDMFSTLFISVAPATCVYWALEM